MIINILGTDYDIRYATDADGAKIEGVNGYCELMTKEIVIGKFGDEPTAFADIEAFERKVIRHEIVHAFLYESGLHSNSEWATNEELVDWIAIQAPKMMQVFDIVEQVWN